VNTDFDINLVLDELRKRNKIFRNEDDLKQKLRDVIRDMYENTRIETEYRSPFDVRKSIDIVVIRDNEYYPIELKYKKLAFKGIVDNIILNYNPFVLNKGIPLFKGNYFENRLKLEKVVEEKENIVQIHYTIIK